MTISRYDIPLDGRERVLTTVDGRPVEGRPVAVALYPRTGIPGLSEPSLTVWVMAGLWPRHELVVRVVTDDEPVNLLDGWEHAGSANLSPHAGAALIDEDEGADALHVLWQRVRRAGVDEHA